MYQPTTADPAPIWQAYVASGTSRDERLRRFAKVPEQMRPRVASHLRTVQAIETFHMRQGKPRK